MKGRRVPPPRQAADRAVPTMTMAEYTALMLSHPAVYNLEVRHDDGCPAIGTGQGCVCEPDVFLRAADWRLIAEVRG